MNPKYFIGPMSKNIVDSILEFSNETNNYIGLIPSRRQIEWNGGYVNNWTTETFSDYIITKSNKILLERDHSGPNQGEHDDSGFLSLLYDCNNFDLIHIDPWKKYPSFEQGLIHTKEMIEFCNRINPKIKFEIGTEQSIRKFETNELFNLMTELQKQLPESVFKQIKYLVIQSGTALKGNNQIGSYDSKRLKEMIDICKNFSILSKEHNGDYISEITIKEKFNIGLNSINIAPEFGLIETQTYLNEITDEKILENYFNICYNSKKWIKWVDKNFNPFENKIELIRICGHYVLSNPNFLNDIKQKFPNIDEKIKLNIKNKLNKLYE